MNLKSLIILFIVLFPTLLRANEPDTAYLFSYTIENRNNSSGLHYAWSTNGVDFNGIGPEFRFLSSDFGAWGSQKKMFHPFLFQDENKTWHCLWTLNNEVDQFAHTSTNDLYNWKSQSYPHVSIDGNIQQIEVSKLNESYKITWLSEIDGEQKIYKTTTTDFKDYTTTEEGTKNDRKNLRKKVLVNGKEQTGVVQKIEWKYIEKLIKQYEWEQYHEQQRAETTQQDAQRFKDLEPVNASFTLHPEKSKAISDKLIGIFFEDINYAADGGIYAELIQNRGFEYSTADKKGRDKNWNSKMAWSLTGEGVSFEIDSINPIHENQKHFAIISTEKIGAGLANEGFDGIVIREGEKYDLSIWTKNLSSENQALKIQLINQEQKIIGETTVKKLKNKWNKNEAIIKATGNCNIAKLVIIPQTKGKFAVDLISLFPQNTFKNRKNGLRPDLAEIIADIQPKFIRFPGGCVAHGDGLNNMYRWKNTVGPIETRKTQRNIWNYHQSAGLGYYEYFQFCEDINADPLPVLPAGVPCQNSSCGGHGQQGGIPMCEMDNYIQEVLDLIEWANGDKNSKWGKIRAEAGHPEPFNLKYLGIGNEDLITSIFEERFTMIFNAVKEKYPEIIVIGTVGPFYRGSDYTVGWELATKLNVPMVDEHYYQPPGWFINNQEYYDKYDRSKPKVYLGEYASHLPGRPMNIETALSEALYLTAVERNADVVSMTSFAPLFAKEGHTQWNPDLIYFNNTEVKPTVDYYVQKLYGQNSGDQYIPTFSNISTRSSDVKKRIAISTVKDTKSNSLIVKLVNMLPVEVNADIDLSGQLTTEQEAILNVLKGEPNNKKAKPIESTLSITDKFEYSLPAYSFSVIRVELSE